MEIQSEMPVTGTFKRKLSQSLLILRAEEPYIEDYQMKMLKENEIEGLLEVRGKGLDNASVYEYDVSGKTSIKSIFDNSQFTPGEIKQCIAQIKNVVEKINNYLLDADALVLEPEYIFRGEGKYFFCYCPKWRRNIRGAFHKLTEFFVQHTDYQNIQCIKMVFMLHKETMEDNYSLKMIMDNLQSIENEDPANKESEDKSDLFSYDEKEPDWITCQEMGNQMLNEEDRFWNPVKRFLQKHRKPKWGDFEGLYINEEDFDEE